MSMTKHHDLYAIGNALVDTEYEVTDQLLQDAGVAKRHMTLIDAQRRTELLHHVQGMHARRTGGGSAGNTVVALAQLGGKAFYSCRVADDELGAFYTKDLLSHGVATNLTASKAPTGQTGMCMVMVTPDAERSMSTFLGATADIDASSLQPDDIRKSKIYYMEGYLQTPADHIKVNPYLDLDKLIVDGDVPPIYMITSVEDFIADNTYELARILHARHKDHAMSVWPKGRERVLGHVFNIVQAGQSLSRYDAREFAPGLGKPAASLITTRDRLVWPRKQRALAKALDAFVIELHDDHLASWTSADDFSKATLHLVQHVDGEAR